MKCSQCGKKIRSGYVVINGRDICTECHASSGEQIRVPDSESHKADTVKHKGFGYMPWWLALILLELIAQFLMPLSVGFFSSFAETYHSLICVSIGCLVFVRLFLNWCWFIFTSRRYWSSKFWHVYSVLRIFAPLLVDYQEIDELIRQVILHGGTTDINPVVYIVLHLSCNLVLYYLFYRRNKREFEKSIQQWTEEVARKRTNGVAQVSTETQKLENMLDEKLKRRNLLYDGQRPEDDDYGYSKENPICTSTIKSSDEYLSHLRTSDGEGFNWIRKGSTCLANCHNVQNVMIDTYILYLQGKPFKSIYICPYGHNSPYAPKGLKLVDEAFAKGGDLLLEAEKRGMSVQSLIVIKALEYEQELEKNPLKYKHSVDVNYEKECAEFLENISPTLDEIPSTLRIFDDAYLAIINSLSTLSFVEKSCLKAETVLFLVALSDYVALCKKIDRNALHKKAKYWLVDVQPGCENLLKSRMSFYGEIIRGKQLRGEWLFGNVESINNNPILKCITAFGDMVINPACANDYDFASVLVMDFSNVMTFANVMQNQVTSAIQTFCNSLYLD